MRRSIPAILLLLATACATYEASPIVPEERAAVLQERTFDDPGLADYLSANGLSLPPADGWDLEHLTFAAFYFNPQMDLARARVATAEAEALEAGLRLDPAVGLGPTYDTTTPPPWIYTVDLALPFTTAGKRGYRMAEAGHLTAAARLDLAGTAWEVRAGLRAALTGFSAAQGALSLERDREALYAGILDRVRQRNAAGESSDLELEETRREAQTARLDRASAERAFIAARAGLAAAIGVPQGALESLRVATSDLGRLPNEVARPDMRRAAVLNRTDVRSALSVYAASQSALQLEIAKQVPDLEIGPGYELDQTDDKWTLGLSFTLPLVNRNRGGIAMAEAHRREAAATFDIVQNRALQEVDRALDAFALARIEAATADSLARSLERSLRAVEERAAAGDLGPLDVLRARIRYDEGELMRLEAVQRVQDALGDLESAAQMPLGARGSPWPDMPPPERRTRRP